MCLEHSNMDNCIMFLEKRKVQNSPMQLISKYNAYNDLLIELA